MHKIHRSFCGLCLTLCFVCYVLHRNISDPELSDYLNGKDKNSIIEHENEINLLRNKLSHVTNQEQSSFPNSYQNNITNQLSRCRKWKPSDWLLKNAKHLAPHFKTSPTRFLLPWLYNGPNNQLLGLRQAIFVALHLNRTLVMPTFQKHFNDGSTDGELSYIDANHRLDVPTLQRLISVITVEEYRKRCGPKVDIVFFGTTTHNMQWTVDSLKNAEKLYNLDFIAEKYKPPNTMVGGDSIVKTSFLPAKGSSFVFEASHDMVLSQFESSLSCALYAFPFRELRFVKSEIENTQINAKKFLENGKVESVPGSLLYDIITEHTQCPHYIQEIADAYIEKRFKNKEYIALHWRYDKDDFYKFMCTEGGNKQKANGKVSRFFKTFCREIFNMTSSTLPRGIRGFLTKVVKKSKHLDLPVYVAAPSSLTEWISTGFKQHAVEFGLLYYDAQDLRDFFREEDFMNRCSFVKRNANDVISLVETEISIESSELYLAQIFFGSRLSSWTDNVKASKKFKRRPSSQLNQIGCNVDVLVTKYAAVGL
uniref:uncharacterized protein LOC100175784 isoform X1 n=1 Tax=Ciona intestinalis TaxID=7719 RepID=UPI000EF52333|nr:uncharacterized protein LOC100175784 isoform X1 [Ciona intestinalis]|eukprot:XP_026694318.1 uncharacterized protein LOC100175784 isoform X1 [Ciona intestinalis]